MYKYYYKYYYLYIFFFFFFRKEHENIILISKGKNKPQSFKNIVKTCIVFTKFCHALYLKAFEEICLPIIFTFEVIDTICFAYFNINLGLKKKI